MIYFCFSGKDGEKDSSGNEDEESECHFLFHQPGIAAKSNLSN